MKRFTILAILIGAVGAFFSGFGFWMANSSHHEAERLRRDGRDCTVEVIGKHTSSPGDDSSTFHYVNVKPLEPGGEARPITVRVVDSTYQELHLAQRLQAWVLGTDALLDYGSKNAASVAQVMLFTCMGFGLVAVAGLTLMVLGRTSRLQATAR